MSNSNRIPPHSALTRIDIIEQCKDVCPQGNQCALGRHCKHRWHVCGNEFCACHSKGRYELEKKMDELVICNKDFQQP